MFNAKLRHRQGRFVNARYEDKTFSAGTPEDLDVLILAHWPDTNDSNTRALATWMD